MSDDIRIATGEYVPIQDTVCECGHWYDEHDVGTNCDAPGCSCVGFIADPEASTPEAIADRGGDPELWPEHVKRAAEMRREIATYSAAELDKELAFAEAFGDTGASHAATWLHALRVAKGTA